MARRPRKVQILGGGWSKGNVPPLDPAAEETWGFNALMFTRFAGDFDGWTRWFDLHNADFTPARHPDRWAWYQQQTKPVYRWEVDPRLPSSVAYPKADVQAFFADGELERDFGGSLPWLMALAVFEGVPGDAIEVFWCPQDDARHRKQIASCRYWMGQARGRGLSVRIHGDSGITDYGPLYGCDTT